MAAGVKSSYQYVVISGTDLKVKTVGDKKIVIESTNSGVNIQPIGLNETRKGATNRAQFALDKHPKGVLAIGIESGLVHRPNGWFDMICFVCAERIGRFIVFSEEWSNAFSMPIPEELAELAIKDPTKPYVQFAEKIEKYKTLPKNTNEENLTELLYRLLNMTNTATV